MQGTLWRGWSPWRTIQLHNTMKGLVSMKNNPITVGQNLWKSEWYTTQNILKQIIYIYIYLWRTRWKQTLMNTTPALNSFFFAFTHWFSVCVSNLSSSFCDYYCHEFLQIIFLFIIIRRKNKRKKQQKSESGRRIRQNKGAKCSQSLNLSSTDF
jgi:hypothetical protein